MAKQEAKGSWLDLVQKHKFDVWPTMYASCYGSKYYKGFGFQIMKVHGLAL